MTKLQRLKKEALESCRFRGHKMKRFVGYRHGWGIDPEIAYAYCKICDKQVIVITKPLPNEIEIGGEAVALNCKD